MLPLSLHLVALLVERERVVTGIGTNAERDNDVILVVAWGQRDGAINLVLMLPE